MHCNGYTTNLYPSTSHMCYFYTQVSPLLTFWCQYSDSFYLHLTSVQWNKTSLSLLDTDNSAPLNPSKTIKTQSILRGMCAPSRLSGIREGAREDTLHPCISDGAWANERDVFGVVLSERRPRPFRDTIHTTLASWQNTQSNQDVFLFFF